MAGVPHHALDGYLAKLVAQQRIVALAEQLEAPVPNKLVRRDVVRIVTPGTLIEETAARRASNNYLAAVTVASTTRSGSLTPTSRPGHAPATAFSGEGAYRRRSWPNSRGSLRPRSSPTCPRSVRAAVRRRVDAAVRALPRRRWRRSRRASARRSTASRSTSRWRCIARSTRSAAFVRASASTRRSGVSLRAPEFYRARNFLALDPATRKHWICQRARRESAGDAARDARPLRDLDGLADARALDPRAAGRSRRDRAPAGRVEDARRRHARATRTCKNCLSGCFDLERIAQKVRFRRATAARSGVAAPHARLLGPLREALPAALDAFRERIGTHDELLDAACDLAHARRRPARDARRRRRDSARRRSPSSPNVSSCAATRANGSPRSKSASASAPASRRCGSSTPAPSATRSRSANPTSRSCPPTTCASRR